MSEQKKSADVAKGTTDANDSNVGDHVPTAVLDALQNFPTFPTLAKSVTIYVLVEQRLERLKEKVALRLRQINRDLCQVFWFGRGLLPIH